MACCRDQLHCTMLRGLRNAQITVQRVCKKPQLGQARSYLVIDVVVQTVSQGMDVLGIVLHLLGSNVASCPQAHNQR